MFPLVPLHPAGVFPRVGSARIGRHRLHWTAARAKVISTAILALAAILPLVLLCLQPLAMVGAVVPAGLTVGAPVIFTFMQGKREQVGWGSGVLAVLEVVGAQLVLWRHWCFVALLGYATAVGVAEMGTWSWESPGGVFGWLTAKFHPWPVAAPL